MQRYAYFFLILQKSNYQLIKDLNKYTIRSLSAGYILKTAYSSIKIKINNKVNEQLDNGVYAFAKAENKKHLYDNMSQNK
ncbi:hypothetical protein FNJ87_05820 [Nonlabens mediterrranea]|uniref:Uncharacterized protein n=1 Tax=Nonlabens mediterrranea TaxID=1419947 RepID=A0ABS0A3E1_9FLAO|nr:hypothetical protein [Nonlabens mediterrranea]